MMDTQTWKPSADDGLRSAYTKEPFLQLATQRQPNSTTRVLYYQVHPSGTRGSSEAILIPVRGRRSLQRANGSQPPPVRGASRRGQGCWTGQPTAFCTPSIRIQHRKGQSAVKSLLARSDQSRTPSRSLPPIKPSRQSHAEIAPALRLAPLVPYSNRGHRGHRGHAASAQAKGQVTFRVPPHHLPIRHAWIELCQHEGPITVATLLLAWRRRCRS